MRFHGYEVEATKRVKIFMDGLAATECNKLDDRSEGWMIILIDFTFITLVYSRGKAETTPYP